MAKDLEPQHVYKKARTPEARARQMQALAVDLSEKRLREGTASAAEIVYWLKQTSEREQLEIENLRMQRVLLQAKTDQINNQSKDHEAYATAMEFFAGYLPSTNDDVIEGEFTES